MNNALEFFLIKIANEFTSDLIKSKMIIKCGFCDDLISYRKGKKYCSFSSEDKDCGKQARNARYYSANKNEILPKARKSTEELRKFYKEKGIKK